MFEREAKREKILEARHREMRLKERSKSEQGKEEDVKEPESEIISEDLIAQAEKDFFEIIEAERKKREHEEAKALVDINKKEMYEENEDVKLK
ncbi:dynein axonemal intermediate chain 2-like, partial [Protopterus annectens]|uniref:dynein axonemal intermediate chain 2-like n=1 Tax=Protopterus annectens TaxID=7888 RepID=UPI001CFB1A35